MKMKIENDALISLFAGTDAFHRPLLFRDLWREGWLSTGQAAAILPSMWDLKDARDTLTTDEWTELFEDMPTHDSTGQEIEIERDLTVWRWGYLGEARSEEYGLEWTDRAAAMTERDLDTGYHELRVLYQYEAKNYEVMARYGEEGAYRYILSGIDADRVEMETN